MFDVRPQEFCAPCNGGTLFNRQPDAHRVVASFGPRTYVFPATTVNFSVRLPPQTMHHRSQVCDYGHGVSLNRSANCLIRKWEA
jgi:hypothetical protein